MSRAVAVVPPEPVHHVFLIVDSRGDHVTDIGESIAPTESEGIGEVDGIAVAVGVEVDAARVAYGVAVQLLVRRTEVFLFFPTTLFHKSDKLIV